MHDIFLLEESSFNYRLWNQVGYESNQHIHTFMANSSLSILTLTFFFFLIQDRISNLT